MTTKQTYWIANPDGRYALVEGADERDRWTRVLGWREADEPPATAQTYIQHPDGLTGCIPFEALAAGWSGLGWTAGPPLEPVDITKDPVLTDPKPPTVVDEPAKQKTQAATGGDKSKE